MTRKSYRGHRQVSGAKIGAPENPEDQIQESIVAYLRTVLPGAIVHHSPNEGNRGGKAGKADGARRKAMGLVPGYPDITIHNHGLTMLLEVKSAKGTLSTEQRAMRDNLISQRIPYGLVRSIDDARAFLILWNVRFIENVDWRGGVV